MEIHVSTLILYPPPPPSFLFVKVGPISIKRGKSLKRNKFPNLKHKVIIMVLVQLLVGSVWFTFTKTFK